MLNYNINVLFKYITKNAINKLINTHHLFSILKDDREYTKGKYRTVISLKFFVLLLNYSKKTLSKSKNTKRGIKKFCSTCLRSLRKNI